MRFSLWREILFLEFKKIFAYRFNFWFDFLVNLLGRFVLNYFLWLSIFTTQGVERIGGYVFSEMILYLMLAYLIENASAKTGWSDTIISTEIYSGQLNRYLVYPTQVLDFKIISLFAKWLFGIVQMGLGIVLVFAFVDLPPYVQIQPADLLAGILFTLLGALLFFTICYTIELVSFWADNVWSLMVILKFVSGLLGGSYIPLVLFPEWGRSFAMSLPFYYVIAFPAQIILGKVSWVEYIQGCSIVLAWTLGLSFVARFVWRRGLRVYSGVGI